MELINFNQLGLRSDEELLFEALEQQNSKWILSISKTGETYMFSAINSHKPRIFASIDTLHKTIAEFYRDRDISPPNIIVRSIKQCS